MNYAFFGICILSAVCCIAFRALDKHFWGMIAKYVASLSFLVVAVISFAYNPSCSLTYFVPVFLGLLFCHAGDVFLGIKELTPVYRKRLIPIGMLAFLLGHIGIACAYNMTAGFHYACAIIAAGAFVISIGGTFLFRFQTPGWLRVFIGIYAFAITFTAASACYLYVVLKSAGAIMALLGSILLLISDTGLSFVYFKDWRGNRLLSVMEIATYFSGQAFIALAVMFL